MSGEGYQGFCAARGGCQCEVSAVEACDLAAEAETYSAAACLGREERLEEVLHDFGRNTAAVVVDADEGMSADGRHADLYARLRRRCDSFDGVAEHVCHQPVEQPAVGPERHADGQILRLFCRDIMRVAAPSLLCGGIAAVIIGRNWLSQFTEQVSLSPLAMAGCLLILLALIIAVVALNARRVARSNPVDYLRAE